MEGALEVSALFLFLRQGLSFLGKNWLSLLCTALILAVSYAFYLVSNIAYYDAAGKRVQGPDNCYVYSESEITKLKQSRLDKKASLYLGKLLERFGNGKYFGFKVLGMQVLVLADPDMVKVVLTGHHLKFPKSSRYERVKVFLREGLVTSSGLKWQMHRRLINPGFHAEAFDGMIDTFISKSDQMCHQWERILSMTGGFPFELDLCDALQSLTLRIICKTGFGYEYSPVKKKSRRGQGQGMGGQGQFMGMQEHQENDRGGGEDGEFPDLNLVLDEINNRLVQPTDWWHLMSPMRSAVITHAIGKTDKIIMTMVNKRLKEREQQKQVLESKTKEVEKTEKEKEKKAPADLLDILLDANEASEKGGKGEKLPKIAPNELCDHILTFIGAGHETTATTLLWMFHELCEHPEIQEKIQKEIDATLLGTVKGKNKRSLTSADVKSCFPYLKMVLKETMRLHPAAPNLARSCAEDVQIGDVLVPKGSTVVVNIYNLHRNPEYWPEPLKFDPERFAEGKTLKHPFSYVPFSAGPRNCIGQRFAILEAVALSVNILGRFSLSMGEEAKGKIKFEETIVMAPKDFEVTITSRE